MQHDGTSQHPQQQDRNAECTVVGSSICTLVVISAQDWLMASASWDVAFRVALSGVFSLLG